MPVYSLKVQGKSAGSGPGNLSGQRIDYIFKAVQVSPG